MKQNFDGSENGIPEIPSVLEKIECEDIIKQKNLKLEYQKNYRNTHKEYNKIYHKNYYENNKERLRQYNKEYRARNSHKLSINSSKYYRQNANKIHIYNLKRKDSRSSYNKKYYKENRNKLSKYRSEYLSNRYKTDILFKIKQLLRSRLNDACRDKGFVKSRKTIQVLGCNLEQFKSHIESLFTTGMGWANYGKLGWHIDHIIPLASAKTQQELEALCHYKNLQPLWWNDNLRKGSRTITQL